MKIDPLFKGYFECQVCHMRSVTFVAHTDEHHTISSTFERLHTPCNIERNGYEKRAASILTWVRWYEQALPLPFEQGALF